jgi:hypothetical protein
MEQLMLDHNSRSAMVRGYIESINTLFKLCNFDPPADLSDCTNMCTKIIVAREKEECIAWQRSPITREIYSALLDQASKSLVDSAKTVVFDWFTLVQITGLRCAEYAQKTQTNVEEHEYVSGKRVVKAFVPSDWKFYNSKGRLIIDPMEVPKKLKMTFRIQKNRQNGQSITLVTNNAHQDICPVRAAHRIYLRAKKLNQSDSEPMGVFVNKFGIKKYLTGGKIAKVLQSVAKIVHPDWSADKLSRISSHLGRVWALILLDEAGMTPAFMTSRLRWMGDSYKLYLRDTSILQHKHIDALKKESDELMKLLGINKNALPNVVPVDNDMGDY